MGLFREGAVQAFRLLLAGDAEVWRSPPLAADLGAATALSLLVGIPLGTALALRASPAAAW